jgi:hypothetical protein
MNWWDLPGPSAFIERICDDLRDGNNVIIQVPEFMPYGMKTALVRRLDGTVLIRSLQLTKEDNNPVDYLFERETSSAPAGVLRNANSLVAYLVPGTLFWMTGMCSVLWRNWKQFIAEYRHACGSIQVLDRPLFCVVLQGDLATEQVRPDVRLSVHRFDDCTSRTDSALYSSVLMNASQSLCVEVASAVVGQLSLWDADLAEELATESPSVLFDPIERLKVVAESRTWEKVCGNDDLFWSKGYGMRYRGKLVLHSAYLALVGDEEEIAARVWSGQLATVFPKIEEIRRELIRRYGKSFLMPHDTPRGPIEDIRDLEIGHIYTQLNLIPCSSDDRSLAGRMTAMRHALAHLDCVPVDLLEEALALAAHF